MPTIILQAEASAKRQSGNSVLDIRISTVTICINILKSKGYSDELLRESGLFNVDERQGMYDKFWNRVIFPIMDVNNRVIGFGGRVMGDGKPKYLNSPETKYF